MPVATSDLDGDSSNPTSTPVDPRMQRSIRTFQECLRNSTNIVALCGAGLSASSGLPTFRGAGGMWRTHEATDLATPQAFERDPALVWQFYSYRKHMALQVKPNKAHYALAELDRKMPGFITITQNVDGLSQRAGHPPEKLHLLHGSLTDVKCSSFFCNYFEANNLTDPIVPALALPSEDFDPTTNDARAARDLDISDINVALPELDHKDLPHCPKCNGFLRPGVVWFGESLPSNTLKAVDDYIEQASRIDLCLVIGTSARVFPAAAYIEEVRAKGARVAIFNKDGDLPANGVRSRDWLFQGDAAELLPELLRPIIGELEVPEESL